MSPWFLHVPFIFNFAILVIFFLTVFNNSIPPAWEPLDHWCITIIEDTWDPYGWRCSRCQKDECEARTITENHVKHNMEWECVEAVFQGQGRKESGKGKENGAWGTWCFNCGEKWWLDVWIRHSDSKEERFTIEHMLVERGQVPYFLPKCHPELNPIERVWRDHTVAILSHPYIRTFLFHMTLWQLRTFLTISVKYSVQHYMFGYLKGLTPGQELDKNSRKYKKVIKSHRLMSNFGHDMFAAVLSLLYFLSYIYQRVGRLST